MMARNKSSMQYTMLKSALEGVKNNNTTKSYKKLIKRFCIWAKEEGYNNIDQVDVACIQKFELLLENKFVGAYELMLQELNKEIYDCVRI